MRHTVQELVNTYNKTVRLAKRLHPILSDGLGINYTQCDRMVEVPDPGRAGILECPELVDDAYDILQKYSILLEEQVNAYEVYGTANFHRVSRADRDGIHRDIEELEQYLGGMATCFRALVVDPVRFVREATENLSNLDYDPAKAMQTHSVKK